MSSHANFKLWGLLRLAPSQLNNPNACLHIKLTQLCRQRGNSLYCPDENVGGGRREGYDDDDGGKSLIRTDSDLIP